VRKFTAFACAAALGCAAAAAQESPRERGRTTGASSGSLLLSLDRNQVHSRIGLDWALRWDFEDLRSVRPGFGMISAGARAISSWDITRNTRVNYYGLRTNPWRLFLSDGDKQGAAAGPDAGTGGGDGAKPGNGAGKAANGNGGRKFRLSLVPLVEDVRHSLDLTVRETLLKESLKGASPEWTRIGSDGRREFVRDVLSLGIWDVPVPVLRESRSALEYLEKKPR
jgi:hypothetical protein